MKLAEEQPIFCPLLKKDCIGKKCMWFTKLTGIDSNTGQQVDEFFCAPVAQALLLTENAKESRQTGAAVESLRNRVAEGNAVLAAGINMYGVKALSHGDN